MWPNPQFPADLVIFTEETLNGKLHFLWSERIFQNATHEAVYSINFNSSQFDLHTQNLQESYHFEKPKIYRIASLENANFYVYHSI